MITPIRFFSCHLALVVAAGLFSSAGQAASNSVSGTLRGIIVEVTSGDSVLLRTEDNREIPLYLWGIDSPEITNKTGKRARKLTARLVEGERITAEVKARTSDGRLLCRVLFDGDRDLAEALLSEGYAVWVTKLAPDETAYGAAQTRAQDKRKGLWKQWLPKTGL